MLLLNTIANLLILDIGYHLEPEIDERTETCGIEGSNAENEHDGGNNPNPDVVSVAVVGVVNFLLHFLAPSRQGEEREEGRDGQDGIYLRIAHEGEATEIEGKHASDEGPGQADVFDTEEHPDDANGEESEDDRWHGADFLHHFAK